MKILHVVGARPNFMKAAPVLAALRAYLEIVSVLVHTGQHYDPLLSDLFFEQLGLPRPEVNLGVGSGSHAEQTAKVMLALEPILASEKPDLALVVGDVNSTLAAAITAAKMGIAVAHVEAGLRSRDRTMPEEINRILTDAVSEVLFTTARDANENLKKEGVPEEKIFFVGNPMIDSLLRHRAAAEASPIRRTLGVEGKPYALLTLHRPSNVDDASSLSRILEALSWLAGQVSVIFPIHPRTEAALKKSGLAARLSSITGLKTCAPLPYLDFLCLMSHAAVVLTDSGGIQEETTVLGVPCLTLRENTERPVTLTEGTNVLVGNDPEAIKREASRALQGERPAGRRPELWDGRAGERIAKVLAGRAAS